MRQRLKRHWGKIVLIVGVVLVMIVEALFLTADHWWKRLGQARITYNGQPSDNSCLYRSRDGDLLVIVEAEGRETQYVILTLNQMIGKADQINFILLPGFAYSRNVPPSLVLIDNVKVEVDPQLIVQERLVEFNSLDQGRVRVIW